MKKRKRKDEEPDGSAMFSEPPPSALRITPEDIQQKEFGAARMGGYRHHEVDEFLDELTRAMGELLEENERLRKAAPPPTPSPTAAPGSGPAIPPFLERERDFLRSLGELVQEHMEHVRSMARSATPEERTVGSNAKGGPSPTGGAGLGAAAAAGADAGAGPTPDAVVEPAAPPAEAPSEPSSVPSATEPISVVEAEPATATRGDEGGLRELFWGEDE